MMIDLSSLSLTHTHTIGSVHIFSGIQSLLTQSITLSRNTDI